LWSDDFSFCMRLKILSLGFFCLLHWNKIKGILYFQWCLPSNSQRHWKQCWYIENQLKWWIFWKGVSKRSCSTIKVFHELIALYTLEQNGCVEWKNCIIMKCVHNMLNSSGVDIKFWVEAAHTYVYILNCASL